MKITKEGNIERAKRTKQFTCECCGCEFEADRGEYNNALATDEKGYHYIMYWAFCPGCNEVAFEKKEEVKNDDRNT